MPQISTRTKSTYLDVFWPVDREFHAETHRDQGTQHPLPGIVNLTIDGKIEPAKPSCLCAHHFLPDLKDLGAQQSVMDRLHEVAAETKEILGESV